MENSPVRIILLVSMKVISIDVGIKNLAVCFFDTLSTTDFIIPVWKVIDIENQPPCLCEYKQVNKLHGCKKKATMADENNHFFCNTHATDKGDNKDKKYKKIKKETTNMITLGKNLKKEFDAIFDPHQPIDLVIIENQISPIASKMTTLQGMIAQYFIMKNVDDIKYISASNKLKYFEMKKNTYIERKKMSVIKCREIYLTIPSLLSTDLVAYEKSNKKDDLADSFLQGIVYLIDSKQLSLPLLCS